MKMPNNAVIILITAIFLFAGCVEKDVNNQPVQTGTPAQTAVPIQTNTPIQTTSINENAQKVTYLAKEDLAKTLSIKFSTQLSVDDIKLSNIEEVTWPDSSLGYPEFGMQYLQVETPGYKIFLSYENTTYEYHSDYERAVQPPATKKDTR